MITEKERKIILICGPTSMIGRACTQILDQEINALILLGKDKKKCEILLDKLGGTVEFYPTDFASEDQINHSIQTIFKKYGRIDAVIYNVAIYPWKSVDHLSALEFHQTLSVNLTGAFIVTKICAEIMKQQYFGKIVYISSIAGENIGLPYMSAYAASKAGLNGLMRTCAIELGPFNINVNTISPGKVYDISTLHQKDAVEKLKPIPLGRFVVPEDIAHMVEFLISDKGKSITGQNIIIDGGQSVLGEDGHLLRF